MTDLGNTMLEQVGVIGAGAWGTALAAHAARLGHDTLLYAREPEVVADVNDSTIKENRTFLKVCCILGLR